MQTVKKVGILILISDKMDFKTKLFRRNKGRCIVTEGTIQEDTMIINTDPPHSITNWHEKSGKHQYDYGGRPPYSCQKWTTQLDKNIHKQISELNQPFEQMNLECSIQKQ